MALHEVIAQTVAALGYDCVEVERTGGGLLRVTIDFPYTPGQAEQLVNVEDCERVTRQLQYALEVEGIDYKRLEVASPGIDRPLRSELDLARFAGEVVDVTLKQPVGAEVAAAGGDSAIAANRKKFRGSLEKTAAGWQVVWQDELKAAKPGAKVSAKRLAARPVHALGFVWDEVKEVRLAPIVDFKGRQLKAKS